jgi:uncharacterized membrane protein YdjX (TVP38/TMEM64 family)
LPFHLEPKNRLKIVVFLIVVLSIVLVFFYTDVSEYLSPERLKNYLALAGPYAPLIFISAFVAGFFLRIPGFIFIILGAFVFERIPAIIYSLIAISVGTSLTFITARFFLRDTVSNIQIKGVKGLSEKITQRGFFTVVLLRLLFFLIPPLNWVLGLTSVKYRDYLLGTILGVAPGVLIFSLVFGDIGKVDFSTGIRDYRLFLPSMAGILLLAAFFLCKRFLRKWLNRG